jgi:hypothetical protein
VKAKLMFLAAFLIWTVCGFAIIQAAVLNQSLKLGVYLVAVVSLVYMVLVLCNVYKREE